MSGRMDHDNAAAYRNQCDHVCHYLNSNTILRPSTDSAFRYYAPYIFIKSVRFSQHLSTLMSGFLTTFYYLSTLIPMAIIDRVGRRPLLIGGVLSMGLCMFVLAGTTSVNHFATGVVSTIVLFIYLFSFGVGWIPGPWLIASEYAPLATRSQSAALATSSTWIFSFLIAQVTPISITNIGYRTYIIFGVLNIAFVPILYFLYPEVRLIS